MYILEQKKGRSADDKSPLITASHDMSVEQRNLKKDLLAKAKDDNEKLPSESPLWHYVRGPPWAMKVIRAKKRPQVGSLSQTTTFES